MTNTITTDREVVTSRVIAATREQVFAAWTTPSMLARWWGPKGFSTTIHSFELRPEGIWDFTMHGPDGKDYPNTCVFKRINGPAYLEFDHLKEMHFYTAKVSFTEVPGGIHIEWTMRFNTSEDLQPIRPFIEQANEQNMDRLAEFLHGRDMSHPNHY